MERTKLANGEKTSDTCDVSDKPLSIARALEIASVSGAESAVARVRPKIRLNVSTTAGDSVIALI